MEAWERLLNSQFGQSILGPLSWPEGFCVEPSSCESRYPCEDRPFRVTAQCSGAKVSEPARPGGNIVIAFTVCLCHMHSGYPEALGPAEDGI